MNIQFRQNWIPENLKDNKKRHKEPKQPKEPKPKKIKEPKPEPEPPKELTEEEYIQKLIDEKEDILDVKFNEINELQKVINAFKAKQLNDIVLNERCVLVSKISNKLSKMKDKPKEDKEELYNDMIKDIKKYDKYFEIDQSKLLGCDLKY